MTSAPMIHSELPPEQQAPDPSRSLRLSLKPEAPATGYVDGAWWPYSRDLVAELPALVRVLEGTEGGDVRMPRVERVSYNLATWGPTERKVDVDGSVVRLGGYRSQHAHTVDLIDRNQRLTLLVVPPETSAESGQRALTTAAEAGNAGSIEVLLQAGVVPEPDTATGR